MSLRELWFLIGLAAVTTLAVVERSGVQTKAVVTPNPQLQYDESFRYMSHRTVSLDVQSKNPKHLSAESCWWRAASLQIRISLKRSSS